VETNNFFLRLSTSICWIHPIDQPKTFTLLLKFKILDFKTLSHVHVYRIEYLSYRQGPYRIRIVLARSVSNTYRIGKVRIEYVSYWLLTVSSQITVSLYVLLEEYSVSIRKYTNISLQKGRAFFKPMTKSPPDKNPLHCRD